VEVDEPAGLILGDLGELQGRDLLEPRLGDAEVGGKVAADGDGGAPPQLNDSNPGVLGVLTQNPRRHC